MKNRSKTCVFTVGHSNHPWEKFAALLQAAEIRVLVDVRSYPRSRFAHFNQVQLVSRLATLNIAYHFFGDELGGRPNGDAAVDYETMDKMPSYLEALGSALEIAGRQRTALMCSEHEPLTCHRCLLLGRSLAGRRITVRHILRDGSIEPHEETENRLLAATRKKTADLFVGPTERLAAAYRVQAQTLQRKAK